MTRIMARYMSATVLKHFLLFTVISLVLASLIQFMENRDGLLEEADLGVVDVVRFSMLSAPEIYSLLAGFITLVAAVFACVSLARHSELKVMFVAGMSFVQFAVALLPAATVMAMFHFWMENDVLPWSTAELRSWGVGRFDQSYLGEPAGIWAHQGDSILLTGPLPERHQPLVDVELFLLDERSQLIGHIAAKTARFNSGGLLLDDALLTIPGEVQTTRVRDFQFETTLDYETLSSLALHPRDNSAWRTARLLQASGAGAHPRYVYEFWFHKKLSAPVTTALLVLMLAPLAPFFLRMGNTHHVLLFGLAGGFIFFVVDAVLVGMGTDGIIPPLLAAWGPAYLLILGMTGALLMQFRGRKSVASK